ncbi:MAG: serine/threonine-protein phosphatase [Planctomycetota bacterium]|nr:MAG: serine/threonine-protein phosphatase [Planctomycetota bacterium]
MGLAARITLGLGLTSLVFAVVAGFALLQGADKVTEVAVERGRRELAGASAVLHQAEAEVKPGTPLERRRLDWGPASGLDVQSGVAEVDTLDGPRKARIYRVLKPSGEGKIEDFFASAEEDPRVGQQLFFLVALATGGLVLVVVIVGAVIARKVTEPVKAIIEDVMAVSRGRADHAIRTRSAVGEVAHLARAVDRMVRDLVEKQKTREVLQKRQRETEVLRELRRNLRPMRVEPPTGFEIQTTVLEAEGAGTGDFVDSLSDGEGRPTLVVGATAARGMAGALLMAMTRAYLRSAAMAGDSPALACDITNSSLNRDLARGLFASAMVARLEPSGAQVELVSAGHKAPAVRWDAEDGQFRKLQPNGIALGFDSGPVFRKSLEAVHLELKLGDALFLFSPGCFELENAKGQQLGEKGVYSLAKIAVEHGLEAMEKKLKAFLGSVPKVDLAFALLRHNQAS